MQVEDLSRANVVQENKIRLVDTDEETGLNLFCYNGCSNEEKNFIKQCRGLVFHNDTLVMRAFPYADEFSHTETKVLEERLRSFGQWSFYNSYEGALLRLFFFSGKWFLSTHRKLNAFRSKWASKDSFGTLFKKALEHETEINPEFRSFLKEGDNILDRFQASLDKNKQYMFLVRNTSENRIVCQPPGHNESFLFHVGTFINSELSMTENIHIPRPTKLTFLNIDQLLDYIENKVDPGKTQGILCFGPNNTQIKILHAKYAEMYRVRGNVPSINFRYLEVRMDENLRNKLYELYPEYADTFDEMENKLYTVAKTIHESYRSRFIKKNVVVVEPEEYRVMKACHEWHVADRATNFVTLNKVIEELNKQLPSKLNHMIHRTA